MKKTAILIAIMVMITVFATAQTKEIQLQKTIEKTIQITPDATTETVKYVNFQGQRKMANEKMYIARISEAPGSNLIKVEVVAEDLKCCDNNRQITIFYLPADAYDFKIYVDEDLKNMQLTYRLYEDVREPIQLASL